MHSAKYLAAVAAFAAFAAAQTCSEDIEISEPTPSIDCEVVEGSITVEEDVAGDLVIDGPEQIKGDLIINNATGILSIRSTTINAIEGKFELVELNGVNTISMDSLESVAELEMLKLTSLRSFKLGTQGVTKANIVKITDTFLNDLSGLQLATVETLQIDNNQRLAMFESGITNVTDTLIINNNGKNMEVTLSKLESAKEIQIANVKTFRVPALEKVGASLKLDKCENIESFSAPNLTSITNALAFINNEKLGNVSLPQLTEIGGDLRIVNNTELTVLDGFPKLERMASINFGGNFEEIDLPSLDNVDGVAAVSTSSKDESVCAFFDGAKEDNKIEGKNNCKYDNENALEGGESEGGQTSNGSGGGGDEDAAGMVSVNSALLGLALIAGIAQLL